MKNIRNILIVLSAVFFVTDILSMRMTAAGKTSTKRWLEERGLVIKKEPETKGLLIFLDDLEKKPEAVGGIFLTGLLEEVCPIIASTSLLYNLREEAHKDTRPIELLLNDLLFLADTNRENDWVEKQNIAINRIGFTKERWIIKKINNSLVLLIPKAYLELLRINSDQVEQYYENLKFSFFSEVELKLGLKVNHMETVTIEQIDKPKESQFADYFIDAMDSIFCTKTDYKNAKITSTEWAIFIEGHGSLNTSVAGLSLNGFQQFLHFLERKIKTQLLMYVSCFAVGINSDKIFGNMKSQVKSQYSFPIIVRGINDAIGTETRPFVSKKFWREKQEIKVIINTTFTSFVDIANKVKEGNYKGVIKTRLLHVIPQIKLPGIEWLSVDVADKEIVSIGSILAKTHDPQKPLDVVSFFKKDPEIILLYTDDIPFELVINSNKLKVIFSMVSSGLLSDKPEFVIHRINKISLTKNSFMSTLRWFILTGMTRGNKCFLIDEIGWNKDILIFGTTKNSTKFCYKDHNDNLFMAEIKDPLDEDEKIIFKRVKNGSEDEKDYQERLHLAWKLYPLSKLKMEKEIKKIENVVSQQHEKQKERQKSKKEKQQLVEEVLARQREKQKELAAKSSPSAQ